MQNKLEHCESKTQVAPGGSVPGETQGGTTPARYWSHVRAWRALPHDSSDCTVLVDPAEKKYSGHTAAKRLHDPAGPTHSFSFAQTALM
jgi:hypothetical protein